MAALTPQQWQAVFTFLGDPQVMTRKLALTLLDELPGDPEGLTRAQALAAVEKPCTNAFLTDNGFVRVMNPGVHSGAWLVGATYAPVFVRGDLPDDERMAAAESFVRSLRVEKSRGGRSPAAPSVDPRDPADQVMCDEVAASRARKYGFELQGLVDPRDLDPAQVVTLPTPEDVYWVAFRSLNPGDTRIFLADGRTVGRAMRRGVDLIAMAARIEKEQAHSGSEPYALTDRHLPLRRPA
ncbi:MAG: hypothetical protein R2853_21095 [Thermomicrobiales bacterium]